MNPETKLRILKVLLVKPIDHWPYSKLKGVRHAVHGESFLFYIPWSVLLPVFAALTYWVNR